MVPVTQKACINQPTKGLHTETRNLQRNMRSVGCLPFIAFSKMATLAASSWLSLGLLNWSTCFVRNLGSQDMQR